jgi:hypothetical protein
MNTQNNNGQSGTDFGPVIYSYTRAQAVADGVQVEVTKTAKEAGIKFPVFLTRTVFDSFVTVPEGVTGQDEAGRLWDIVWMLRSESFAAAQVRQVQLALASPLRFMSATTTAQRGWSNSSPLAAHWTLTTRSPPSP